MTKTKTTTAARIIFTGVLAAAPAATAAVAYAQPAPPPPAPAADTPDVRDARAAAKAFAVALGDPDVAKARGLFAGTPEDLKVIEQTHAAMKSMAKFKAAAIKAFPDLAKEKGNDLTSESLQASIDRQAAKVDGNQVMFGDGVVVRKTDGQWRVVDLYGSGLGKAMMVPLTAALAKASDELTPDIEAGKFKTQQELKQAMGAKLQAAMQALRPPMPGTTTRPATSPSR